MYQYHGVEDFDRPNFFVTAGIGITVASQSIVYSVLKESYLLGQLMIVTSDE